MNINKITLIALLALAFVSCSEDFLEKTSPGSLAADNFFQTEEHAVWGTNAVYEHLRAWEVHVFSFIGMTDIISDDSDKGSTVNDASFLKEIDDFTFDASNIAPATVWSGYYRGIYRANVALENIPNIEMDEALQSRLLGECKFLRAYFYFNLVRWFGDLPLITKPLEASEFEQERVPAADIYALIKQDLRDAIDQLPLKSKYPSQELGRATKGAAQGLLAKVHLTLQEFGEAETLLLEVIQSEEYALMPDYQKIFTAEGENAEESLFEV
nr:RagB/SusD family nutrient uptake outer membrane protein [Saprospiraceae bacterium]